MADIAFPLDLIESQRDWNHVRAALARRPVKTPQLLNRWKTLTARVAVHSFWETEDGKSPSAREDLRRRVPEMEEAEERLTDRKRRTSLRQIGQSVGLSSTASVAYQLNKLEEAGLIDRRSHGRGIALRW